MSWHGRTDEDGNQLCDKDGCPNKWTWTFSQAFFCENHGKGMLDMFEDPELQASDDDLSPEGRGLICVVIDCEHEATHFYSYAEFCDAHWSKDMDFISIDDASEYLEESPEPF